MFTRLSANFADLLAPNFQLDELEASEAIVFGLWRDFSLAYVNPAWVCFADSNDGQPYINDVWGVGSQYLDAIPGKLRTFYEHFLTAAPVPGTTLHPAAHVYECSSPTVFRQYRMQVYALRERLGYIVNNALVVERPHDPLTRTPHDPDLPQYVDAVGIITQCSHCRLVRHVGARERWDWVPAWVEHVQPNTSHGLCAMCFSYYYGTVVGAQSVGAG
jgi:hypothetical protein